MARLGKTLKNRIRRGLVKAVALGGIWLSPGSMFGQDTVVTSPAVSAILPLPMNQAPAPIVNPLVRLPGDAQPDPSPGKAAAESTRYLDAPPPGSAAALLSPTEKAAVREVIVDYLTELENKRKAKIDWEKQAAEQQGHQVGSDLNLQASWMEGVGLVFSTANEDWKIHVGGRFQYEQVFFQQPQHLKGPGTPSGGILGSKPNGGLDSLDDGSYFRRVRFRSDGVGYETIEYILEVDFEQLNYITFDHLWFGAKDVPFLGTVRIGQQKTPQGMENIGSDYHLTFLERSAGSDAFSTLFSQGLLIANDAFNQNVTWQAMISKFQQQNFYTSTFGDGNMGVTGRVTWTPIYEDDGREIVHFGNSYQFRTGNLGREVTPGGTGSAYGDSQNVIRFRSRGDVRDAIGIGGGGNLGGDADRFVDTGFLTTSGIHTMVPEFLLIWGSFSVQAEGYWNWIENAATVSQTSKAGTALGTPMVWSTYAEASYFLTGERRGYDRRFGTYDRPVLNENAYLVRGQDGALHGNWGAWQLAYRYSFMDLNGNNGNVGGGQLGQHTFGLNWYINNTTKIQFQYSIIGRDVADPAVSGTVHAFGMLAQWYF